jgi:hypothetical protein
MLLLKPLDFRQDRRPVEFKYARVELDGGYLAVPDLQ